MSTRQEFYLKAREEVGTPFMHQGRYPKLGLDCVGLCVVTGLALGCPIVDTKSYRRAADWDKFLGHIRDNGEYISNRSEDALPGTVVVLREGKYQTHCGVIAELKGERTLIHAYALRDKVVEERFTSEWQSRTVGVFKLFGVE